MTMIARWLKRHKFAAHLTAFLLMILPPVPLYAAALHGNREAIWPLIGLVVLGNLVAMAVR